MNVKERSSGGKLNSNKMCRNDDLKEQLKIMRLELRIVRV
jgi:hypothetical protein